MYYKNGEVFNSQQAIRNDNKDTSLPHFMTDELIESLGYQAVVDVAPTASVTQRVVEGAVELVNGIPTKIYTLVDKTAEELSIEQSDAIASMVQHFTDVTTNYIEDKVQAYNAANGLAFKDIDAFTKYAVTPTSIHNAIAIQFIGYADRVWNAVRTYQASATSAPTEVEFKAVLDGVVF